MRHIVVPIVRIAATTATIPVRVSAATTTATAEIVSWERRLFACSPLSAEARRSNRIYRELRARAAQDVADLGSRNHAASNRAKHTHACAARKSLVTGPALGRTRQVLSMSRHWPTAGR
jgi:hypothetical protein